MTNAVYLKAIQENVNYYLDLQDKLRKHLRPASYAYLTNRIKSAYQLAFAAEILYHPAFSGKGILFNAWSQNVQ